jgi:hypothetical protein
MRLTEDTNDNKNVFQILAGGKTEDVTLAVEPGTPVNEYVIIDKDGQEHFAEGFLIFTSQHVAIMRDAPDGALPVLVMPLSDVKRAELVEDEEVF